LISPAFPVAVAFGLITFFWRPEARLRLLALLLIPLAWLHGRLDYRSLLPTALYLLAGYGLIRIPWRRPIVAGLTALLTVGSLVAARRWLGGSALLTVLALLPVLIPMLWYSAYEQGRGALTLSRFLTYMGSRFVSMPVVTYGDLFTSVSPSRLTPTRWAGVRAIYIALIASIVAKAWEGVAVRVSPDTLTGLPLLLASYGEYVGYYCAVVGRVNLAIGVARLWGVPIRDNFKYWLLARTPNEHWQRWNVLAREWLLTFVFFPIMRGRRWLFGAVMAALLTAGLLHLTPILITTGFRAPRAVASLVYWGMNGLAIYFVIKFPQRFPRAVERLKLRENRVWWVMGIALTSAFYSVLHGVRAESGSWAEMGNYLSRLVTW
jgi:hypothetical protein